jgi:hypothetical protein
MVSGLSAVLGVQQQRLCIMSGWKQTCEMPMNDAPALAAARHVAMPMRQPYWRSIAWLGPTSHIHTIHCRHSLCLIVAFVSVFALLSTCLINQHFCLESLLLSTDCTFIIFCCCYCCHCLIGFHRVVALYSFDQKFVWDRLIVLLFSSSRCLYLRRLPFCFCNGVIVAIVAVRSIVVFCSHRWVVFVAYTPTPHSINRS